MADPHIQSPMDNWDFLTVVIYRLGFVLATFSIFALPYLSYKAYAGLLVAGVMLASSLHLYLKHFRLLFQFAAWIALLCHTFGVPLFALGGMLLVIGGLSYKEYFCFRVFGLNFQPILMALLWISLACEWILPVQILTVIIGGLLAILSVQKWRMPLHFDIGDKSKYQV